MGAYYKGGNKMKKIVCVLSMVFLLTACGGSEEVTSQKSPQEKPKEKGMSVEVTEQKHYIWEDESIGGMEQINTYAIIENTGDTVVDVSQTKANFMNSDGSIITVTQANSMYRNISPSIIGPGESAYLSMKDDYTDEYKDLESINIEVTPIEVNFDVNILEAHTPNVVVSDDWGGSISVTGFLKNNEDSEVADVDAATVFYNAEGEYMGSMVLGVDQYTNMQPNSETSIQFGVPSFPSELVNEVDRAEIKAIGYDYN